MNQHQPLALFFWEGAAAGVHQNPLNNPEFELPYRALGNGTSDQEGHLRVCLVVISTEDCGWMVECMIFENIGKGIIDIFCKELCKSEKV